MAESDNTIDFESSLKKLEGIVDKMEQGQLSLSQSLEAFEEGVKLTRQCQDTLKSAEQRVTQLTQQGSELEGENLVETEFNPTLDD